MCREEVLGYVSVQVLQGILSKQENIVIELATYQEVEWAIKHFAGCLDMSSERESDRYFLMVKPRVHEKPHQCVDQLDETNPQFDSVCKQATSVFESIESIYRSRHEVFIKSNALDIARERLVKYLLHTCPMLGVFRHANTYYFLTNQYRVIEFRRNIIQMSDDIDFDLDDGFCSGDTAEVWNAEFFEAWKNKDCFAACSPFEALRF